MWATQKFVRTPAAASSGILLALAVMADKELYHIGVEQSSIQASVKEEIYIELLGKYRDFPGAVGKSNRAVYRLVQVPRNWNTKFSETLVHVGFDKSIAD